MIEAIPIFQWKETTKDHCQDDIITNAESIGRISDYICIRFDLSLAAYMLSDDVAINQPLAYSAPSPGIYFPENI